MPSKLGIITGLLLWISLLKDLPPHMKQILVNEKSYKTVSRMIQNSKFSS